MLTPSSICNLSRAIGCAARAPGPGVSPGVVLARGGGGCSGPKGRGARCFCRGPRGVLPEGRGGCTNSGYDKYHENYYYFLMAKMFSFLFIMLIYNSANLSFLLYELAYFELSLHLYIFFDKFYVFLSFFNDSFARFIVYLVNHVFHYPIG